VDTECCEAAVALIEACLSQHVSERPTAAQLVAALEAFQDSPAQHSTDAAALPATAATEGWCRVAAPCKKCKRYAGKTHGT
jgi:hypothetical protein